MSIQQTTQEPTEADLEAAIHAALKLAFPWLSSGDLKHQLSFSFKFGKSNIVNNAYKLTAGARADIVVSRNGKNLAILEIKRPGSALTKDDDAQGLSYAYMLNRA